MPSTFVHVVLANRSRESRVSLVFAPSPSTPAPGPPSLRLARGGRPAVAARAGCRGDRDRPGQPLRRRLGRLPGTGSIRTASRSFVVDDENYDGTGQRLASVDTGPATQLTIATAHGATDPTDVHLSLAPSSDALPKQISDFSFDHPDRDVVLDNDMLLEWGWLDVVDAGSVNLLDRSAQHVSVSDAGVCIPVRAHWDASSVESAETRVVVHKADPHGSDALIGPFVVQVASRRLRIGDATSAVEIPVSEWCSVAFDIHDGARQTVQIWLADAAGFGIDR